MAGLADFFDLKIVMKAYRFYPVFHLFHAPLKGKLKTNCINQCCTILFIRKNAVLISLIHSIYYFIKLKKRSYKIPITSYLLIRKKEIRYFKIKHFFL